MMLVVCRKNCERILDTAMEILEKLGIRDVGPYYSERLNWFGISVQRCQRYSPESIDFEGDVSCEAETAGGASPRSSRLQRGSPRSSATLSASYSPLRLHLLTPGAPQLRSLALRTPFG